MVFTSGLRYSVRTKWILNTKPWSAVPERAEMLTIEDRGARGGENVMIYSST
jgi:hypothetical protein